MMTPTVAPLILIFTMVNRQRKQQQNPFVPSSYLLSGYFLVWAEFSLLVTSLQWLLQHKKSSMLVLQIVQKTSNTLYSTLVFLLWKVFLFLYTANLSFHQH
jgi:predicted metal-binding membrane protein